MKRAILLIIPFVFATLISEAQSDFVEKKKSKFKSRLSVGVNAGYQRMKMSYVNDYFANNAGSGNVIEQFPAIEGGPSISASINMHWSESKRLITSLSLGYAQAKSISEVIDSSGTNNVLFQYEYRPVLLSLTASASYKIINTDRFNFQLGAGVSYNIALLLDRVVVDGEPSDFTGSGASNIGVMADSKVEFYILHRISVIGGVGYQYVVVKELRNEEGYLGDGHVELDFSGINFSLGVRLYFF